MSCKMVMHEDVSAVDQTQQHQDAQGNFNYSNCEIPSNEESQHHDDPGNLLALNEFNIGSSYIGDLEISKIEQPKGIKNFKYLSTEHYPLVVKVITINGSTYICMDNFHLIKEATQRGETTIDCKIIPLCCNEENVSVLLPLVKLYTRITPSGRIHYIEIIYFILKSKQGFNAQLQKEGKNMLHYCHGGIRKGESYQKIAEVEFITMASKALRISRNKIATYKKHAEQIQKDLWPRMFETKPTKHFFDILQIVISFITRRYLSQGKTREAINETLLPIFKDALDIWGVKNALSIKKKNLEIFCAKQIRFIASKEEFLKKIPQAEPEEFTTFIPERETLQPCDYLTSKGEEMKEIVQGLRKESEKVIELITNAFAKPELTDIYGEGVMAEMELHSLMNKVKVAMKKEVQ